MADDAAADGSPTDTDAGKSNGTPPRPARGAAVKAVLVAIAAVLLVRAYIVGNGRAYVSTAPGSTAAAAPALALTGQANVSIARTTGLWIAAACTLAIFSFLWRDNAAYKLAEAVLVGVSAAYWMVLTFWTVFVPNVLLPLAPAVTHPLSPGLPQVRDDDWWLTLIPVVLGGMLLMRLAPRGGWIARWPLALIVGTTAGLRLVGYLQADFVAQIRGTIGSVVVAGPTGIDAAETVKATLLVVATLAALAYFFFSVEHRGPIGAVSRVGIWVLMITFGAAFAFTVMGRIALLQIRLEFLFDDWLWLIDPAGRRFTGA